MRNTSNSILVQQNMFTREIILRTHCPTSGRTNAVTSGVARENLHRENEKEDSASVPQEKEDELDIHLHLNAHGES